MSEWRGGSDEASADYAMVLPFVDQSPAFTHGFEAGVQYARMLHGPHREFQQTVHTENQRQLVMAAKVAGWTVRFEPVDETFCEMFAVSNV